MRSIEKSAEDELIEEVAGYDSDPLGFVGDFAYDWGEGDLEGEKLRDWQAETFDHIGKQLRNPKTRFMPIRIAIASGHGIGKSAFIGMLTNWALSTCVDTKIVVTANTETQLWTKTSPEIITWNRLSITGHWFKATTTCVHSTDKKHVKTWRADLVTWSKNNTEAFAGLHNKKKRIVIIYDEASAIDDKVWEVTEGALTDEETEIIWVAFGNPTRNTGRFRECFRKHKNIWYGKQIDARTVKGTNKKQHDEWIETYGLDSDFVKVRVRGLFPAASFKQYISEVDVDAAYGKHLRAEQYNFAPKILTVDPAWEGDDEFVIGLRQGLAFKILGTYPKNDNDIEMAGIIARFEDEEEADAVAVDGGFGTGIVSAGRTWKRNWQIVWASGESPDDDCLNLRSFLWKKKKEWLKAGGAIPEDPILKDELTAPEAVPRVDGKLQIESKKDMKARGIASPNRADALGLSFAIQVPAKRRPNHQASSQARHQADWDPLRRQAPAKHQSNWDPLKRR